MRLCPARCLREQVSSRPKLRVFKTLRRVAPSATQDTNLASALGHGKRQHTVNSDCRQKQREASEEEKIPSLEPFRRRQRCLCIWARSRLQIARRELKGSRRATAVIPDGGSQSIRLGRGPSRPTPCKTCQNPTANKVHRQFGSTANREGAGLTPFAGSFVLHVRELLRSQRTKGPGDVGLPTLVSCPIASLPGKYWRAIVSLMTSTGCRFVTITRIEQASPAGGGCRLPAGSNRQKAR